MAPNPTPVPFPWRNQAQRNLVCPTVRTFTVPGFFAALQPGICEVEALLQDRQPGRQRATRPMQDANGWGIYATQWTRELVPTLERLALQLHRSRAKTTMAEKRSAIHSWNSIVEFFTDLDREP